MSSPSCIGFIGTGTITAHIVRGLKNSNLRDRPITLSPRSKKIAQELARDFKRVEVAKTNQAVIDRADIIILAVRPQIAKDVLRPISFSREIPIISLMATLPIETLRGWTSASRICRAIPLPFVERRCDVIPVFPPLPEAIEIFNALGQALPVTDLTSFDAYASGSALMATYFGMIESTVAWMEAQGIPEMNAATYIGALFSNLSATLAENPTSVSTLRDAHATQGGLNEQLHQEFKAYGGEDAIKAGLEAILKRIKAASPT
ncbi:pyrroline-5-carboxylate reductase [Paracoccus saliphilus]|uniref:NAD(P)-binding domain-containing protein n=1 Tax=Paracoccus saliphilus TaxID=405559 RepID=A0AA46A4V7_9RHOB|nr:pyrroline-5-carboxylate reductase [Paracoccus saliphilus]WCR01381.1 NAD(P)-binding domain-containing protein [Paracoccus saliphilus]SIS70259.1 pyrroline-5-carboxylate reductase [Paracoccus saliphilus]